jgi:hypothetical protein
MASSALIFQNKTKIIYLLIYHDTHDGQRGNMGSISDFSQGSYLHLGHAEGIEVRSGFFLFSAPPDAISGILLLF